VVGEARDAVEVHRVEGHGSGILANSRKRVGFEKDGDGVFRICGFVVSTTSKAPARSLGVVGGYGIENTSKAPARSLSLSEIFRGPLRTGRASSSEPSFASLSKT
jgi:hypothetical protein